jgi:hypothetical protein
MWSQARTYELCFAATDLQELNRSLWDLFFPSILFSSAASFVRVFVIFFSFNSVLTFAMLWLRHLPSPTAEQQERSGLLGRACLSQHYLLSWQLRNWHGRACSRDVRPTCPEADEAFHRAAIMFEVRRGV